MKLRDIPKYQDQSGKTRYHHEKLGIWFHNGKVSQSYQTTYGQREALIAQMLSEGWSIIPDPFRKGAPLGGYRTESSAPLGVPPLEPDGTILCTLTPLKEASA